MFALGVKMSNRPDFLWDVIPKIYDSAKQVCYAKVRDELIDHAQELQAIHDRYFREIDEAVFAAPGSVPQAPDLAFQVKEEIDARLHKALNPGVPQAEPPKWAGRKYNHANGEFEAGAAQPGDDKKEKNERTASITTRAGS